MADEVGVSRVSVTKWRKDPDYLRGLLNLVACRVSERMDRKDAQKAEKLNIDQGRAATHVKIKNNWPRAVRSPIDGKLFTDPDEFFMHLVNSVTQFANSGKTLVTGEPDLEKDEPASDEVAQFCWEDYQPD